VKFHQAAFALAEYATVSGELHLLRFGRDSAGRTTANLRSLDEIQQ
jgi:hypothetical protein